MADRSRSAINVALTPPGRLGTWALARLGGDNLVGRISLYAVWLAGILLGVAGIVSFLFALWLTRSRIETELHHKAALIGQRAELAFNNFQMQAQSLASSTLTANSLLDSSGRDAYLRPFFQDDKILDAGATLTLVDYSGVPIFSTGPASEMAAVNYQQQLWLLEAIENSRPKTELLQGDSQQFRLRMTLPVVYPVTGRAEGALIVEVPLVSLLDLQSGLPAEQLSAVSVRLMSGANIVAGVMPAGAQWMVDYPLLLKAPLVTMEFSLVLGLDRWQAMRPVVSLVMVYLLLGALAVALILPAVKSWARRLAAPIILLTETADEVTQNGMLDIELHGNGTDEIARLARGMAAMLASLRDARTQLEQRVAERTRELRESEQRYLGLLNELPDVVFSLSPDGQRFIYSSPATASVFGTDEIAAGVPTALLLRQIHPLDLALFKQAIEGLRTTNEASVIYRIFRKDGELAWLHTRMRTVFSEFGLALRFDGITTDITERKQFEAALQERNLLLDTIFALSPDGFLSTDGEGVVRHANPAFFHMTGLTARDVLDQSEANLDARLRQLCDVGEEFIGIAALAESDHLQQQRHLIKLAPPQSRVLDTAAVPGRSDSVRYLFYVRDVTHEVEVDRMKTEFLSVAAHELRTPMASIYGFTELLLSETFDAEMQRDLLQTIYNQTELLVKIINELLDLSRIEARRGKDFQLDWVSPEQLVKDTLAGLNFDRKRWPVSVTIAEGVGELYADPGKVHQALMNVLSNASKYSPEGGAIEVFIDSRKPSGPSAAGRADQIGFIVRDRGIGMTEAQLNRVFERFYRADTSGRIPGTGLGMSIVKEIVELHGGEVVVSSQAGRGTEVAMWLPRVRRAGPGVRQAPGLTALDGV